MPDASCIRSHFMQGRVMCLFVTRGGNTTSSSPYSSQKKSLTPEMRLYHSSAENQCFPALGCTYRVPPLAPHFPSPGVCSSTLLCGWPELPELPHFVLPVLGASEDCLTHPLLPEDLSLPHQADNLFTFLLSIFCCFK